MPRSRSHPTEVVARPASEGTARRRKRSRGRRLWLRVRWPLLALGLLFVAAVVDLAVRYLPAVQALQHGRNDVSQAQTLLTGDLAHLDHARVAQAHDLLADAEQDFGSRSEVLADGWIGGVAAHLPWVGSQVDAARLLRAAGEDGTVAGTNILGLVEQLVPSGTTAQLPLLQRLVTVAQDHKADLSTLSIQLAALQADVAGLAHGSLVGPLDSARTTLRTQASKVLATASPAIALLQTLPAAIGAGQHTYLLLLENPGEMRPGGGFIGAVGQVTFANGAISGQIFRDGAFSDPLVTNIPAPRPLKTYPQNNQPWHLAETDWPPDFPTAASAKQKHIVLSFADTRLEALVRGASFDGGVRAPLGDSVEVLDCNLAGTKGDLFVTRRFQLQVTVGADGQAHDQLTLTYHDPIPANAADEALNAGSNGDYRDYIQVLIPETAQFDSITVSVNGTAPQQVSPEAVTYDFQREGIAYWLIVPRGGSATVVLSYEGPFADISRSPTTYALSWERQNGALTWPIDIAVTMPKSGRRQWTSDLSVDRSWSLAAAG